MKKNRLIELDALRGIAALAVVLYHYFYRYNELYNHHDSVVKWLYFGKYGAQFFFVISGFVIYWTLSRVEKPADFLISRFSRLYPVYWIAVIITFSIVSFIGLPGKEVTLLDALCNFLMFQEYLAVPHVDGVYWTLTVELTFYFWIFILYLLGQLNRAEYWMLPVLILAIVQSTGVIILPEIFNKMLNTYHINFFMAGILFFKMSINQTDRFTLPLIICSLVSTAFIISIKHCLVFTVFYVCFYLAVTGHLKFLTFKPFVFLGTVSYSLYLLHQNIGFIIINKFYQNHLPAVYGAILSLIICVIVATLINKYVEKPSLDIIRNLYRNNEKIQRIASIIPFNEGQKTVEKVSDIEKEERIIG